MRHTNVGTDWMACANADRSRECPNLGVSQFANTTIHTHTPEYSERPRSHTHPPTSTHVAKGQHEPCRCTGVCLPCWFCAVLGHAQYTQMCDARQCLECSACHPRQVDAVWFDVGHNNAILLETCRCSRRTHPRALLRRSVACPPHCALYQPPSVLAVPHTIVSI